MSGIYAPDAIYECWDTIKARIPDAQLGGILPPYSSSGGYHNCRAVLPGDDYSVQRADDQKGDAWAASGLDVTMGPTDMSTCTQRLIAATQHGDPRLVGLRSFLGTVDGSTVTGMDVRDRRFITSDPSHLWHVHLSFYRAYACDTATLQGVADVFTGNDTSEEFVTMLRQVRMHDIASGFTLTAGKWRTLSYQQWSPSNMSGGSSVVLPDCGGQFIATLFVKVTGLPTDGNVYLRLQTLDRQGNQRALFPIGEQRGTSGESSFVFTQVGSVPANTNLRGLIAATHDCTVAAAEMRCLY